MYERPPHVSLTIIEAHSLGQNATKREKCHMSAADRFMCIYIEGSPQLI